MTVIYTFWAADECCNQKTFSPLIVFQLLSCSTCSCNSRKEVTPPRYYKGSVSGDLQGLTPFHIKYYIFFLSVSSPIIQASPFSLFPCKLSTSDLNIHQLCQSGVPLFPFLGLLIIKRILFTLCLCPVVDLLAVCCLIRYFSAFVLCRCFCFSL